MCQKCFNSASSSTTATTASTTAPVASTTTAATVSTTSRLLMVHRSAASRPAASPWVVLPGFSRPASTPSVSVPVLPFYDDLELRKEIVLPQIYDDLPPEQPAAWSGGQRRCAIGNQSIGDDLDSVASTDTVLDRK
uniref:Uncharacterized protein n=1 Tax=Fagus sylvatica TaxID=28930 RepID=A0A2N9HX68_FAGSY